MEEEVFITIPVLHGLRELWSCSMSHSCQHPSFHLNFFCACITRPNGYKLFLWGPCVLPLALDPAIDRWSSSQGGGQGPGFPLQSPNCAGETCVLLIPRYFVAKRFWSKSMDNLNGKRQVSPAGIFSLSFMLCIPKIRCVSNTLLVLSS